MLIAFFVLLIIAFLSRILKLKLLLRLQYDAEKKGIRLIVLLFNLRMLDYEFMVEVGEKGHILIKQYRRNKLKEEYTLKTLISRIMRLTKSYKKSFDLVENKLFDTLKRFFIKRVRVDELSLQSRFGLSDAFYTAMALGALYAVLNTLLRRLYEKKKPQKAEVEIKPDFQNAMFEAHFTVMVSVRVSALFTIGAAVVFLFFRNREKEEHP